MGFINAHSGANERGNLEGGKRRKMHLQRVVEVACIQATHLERWISMAGVVRGLLWLTG
jgi:hypothetical protein